MSGEVKHFENAFEIGVQHSLELTHLEDIKDVNVQKSVSLFKKTKRTVFSLMDLNGINEKEINL